MIGFVEQHGRRSGLEMNWGAALLAGLAAGTVFLALEIFTALVFGAGTLLGPAHLTLRGMLEDGAALSRITVGLALGVVMVHYLLSMLLAAVLLLFIHHRGKVFMVGAGVAFGLVLYLINVYAFAIALPEVATGRGLFMLLDYALFGASAAWFYRRIAGGPGTTRRPRRTPGTRDARRISD